MELKFPDCLKCGQGVLLPLSDYGRDGAPITYKAWVCSNPNCGFNIRIDNGEISLGMYAPLSMPLMPEAIDHSTGAGAPVPHPRLITPPTDNALPGAECAGVCPRAVVATDLVAARGSACPERDRHHSSSPRSPALAGAP